MNKIYFLLEASLVCSVLLCSCQGPKQQVKRGRSVAVTIYEVQKEKAVYYDQYPASVVALEEVQIRTEVSGYLTGIFFKEGKRVTKGQKLYEIEQSKFAATYEQAKATLEIAKEDLERTKKDAERYTVLGREDAIAKQRVDYALTDYKNAQQRVVSARADLDRAKTDLQHSVIYAPFTGTIGISSVKPGTFVSAGQTILNTISADNPIGVDFEISEKEIPRLTRLKNEDNNPADSVFTILLPDKSLYAHPGQIELFDRAVDPLTGTLKIRLKFPNPQDILKPGMSCDLRILHKTKGKVLQIPYQSVTEQMSEFFVYRVEKDTAFQQKVSLGQNIGKNVIVEEGLQPGEQIVLDGIQKLRDKTPVTIAMPEKSQTPPVAPIQTKQN